MTGTLAKMLISSVEIGSYFYRMEVGYVHILKKERNCWEHWKIARDTNVPAKADKKDNNN